MTSDYQKRESKAVDAIKKAIPKELKQDMLKESKGMFCELYQNNEVFPNHYMATACDGVGTKIILAEAMHKFDTIGIDLVAMNANDLATFPKMSPFMFINYIAAQSKIQEQGITGEIIKGMVKGLKECDASDILKNNIHVNLGKGETASVDELITGTRKGYAFDVAASMIGFVPKDALKHKVKAGDIIIAIESSGLHSNGYTDARHILLNGDFETRKEFKDLYKGKYSLNDKFGDSTIGQTLLEPTRLYVRLMAEITKTFNVAAVNNTGYGLKNLNRITGFNFIIDDPIKPLPIFNLLQTESNYSDEQMYRKFNMGMGFFIVARKEDADEILTIANKHYTSKIVGRVEKGNSTVTLNKDIVYKGY
jgi:phosphoribosylformylglycinamidine cyclo-ligase